MQKSQLAEKKKVLIDGVEIPGLVSVDEITLTKKMIDVLSFKRIRKIQSDVTELPVVKIKYSIARDTATQTFFEDFYFDNEVKDVVIIRTDAHGSEFSRRLLSQCECAELTDPKYDAANPEYASISVTLVPWDIIPVAAQ